MRIVSSNNHPLLSVIIPMYNCAPVIVRCLESIDYPDCEIIVVNDGSKDNGAEMVEQYASAHPHVRLINKPNGGVSSARNLGIEQAQGKYVCFVDADDYLMANGLARIVEMAENEHADVVLYDANYITEQSLIPIRSVREDKIYSECFESGREVLKRYDIADFYVWDAIFSLQLIRDNRIVFKEDLCVHEDDVFKGEVFSVAQKVIQTGLPLYCYVQTSSHSSTHEQSVTKKRALIDSCWRAVKYRRTYMRERCEDVLPMERLKYMRWVCTPKSAVEAQLSLDEYRVVLEKFREQEVYPLDYRWIEVAHWYASSWRKFKCALRTFLTNHPVLGYWYYMYRKKHSKRNPLACLPK